MVPSLLALLIAGTPVTQTIDPLESARRGLVQCRGPREDGSCDSIVRYTLQADGSYSSFTRVRFSGSPDIVIEMTATVRVEDGRICDRDFTGTGLSARLLLNGAPAPASLVAEYQDELGNYWRQFQGKLVCGVYERSGGRWTATLWVDGVLDPATTGELAWMRPDQCRLAERRADEAAITPHQRRD